METTTDNIKDIMAIHNYTNFGDFVYDDNLLKCIQSINEIDFAGLDISHQRNIPKFFTTLGTKAFFNKYYEIGKVNFIPEEIYNYVFDELKITNVEDYVELYNSLITQANPFVIPTSRTLSSRFDGKLQSIIPIINNESHEYLNDLNVSYSKIFLPKQNTKITTSVYIHELTHALINSKDKIVEDYYNSEVLSIFNELLYVHDINPSLFNIILIDRILNICVNYNSIYNYNSGIENTSELEYHESIKYLTSTLKAIMLLRLYLESINKETFIKLINQCFTGEDSLENVLYDIGVTYEDSIDPSHIRKLIRK